MNKITYITFISLALIGCQSEPQNGNTSEPGGQPSFTYTRSELDKRGFEIMGLTQRSIPRPIEVSGRIDVPPSNRAKVSAFYSGFVQSVRVLPGERVRKGQLLFTLKNPEYLHMQEDYLEAQMQLSYLEADYERLKILASENISSEKNFRKAESDYQVMHARAHALGEQLKLMNLNPEQLTAETITSSYRIYAPLSGYVTEVNICTNEYLDASEVAVGIVNTDHIHLELQVFEQHALLLREGQQIVYTIPESGAQAFIGEIFLVGKSVDPERRTIDVHGHIADEDVSRFIPGMFVKAVITVEEPNQWCLPTSAIRKDGDVDAVLRLVSDRSDTLIFEPMRITVSASFDEWTAVKWMEGLDKEQFLVGAEW